MKHTILLVEDDPDVSATLSGLLRAFGYEVEVARDGNRGLGVLRAGLQPSVIVLDLMMPNMDGRRFREIQLEDPIMKDIPTVVITADTRFDEGRLRASACLRKPFDPAELLEAIKRHC